MSNLRHIARPQTPVTILGDEDERRTGGIDLPGGGDPEPPPPPVVPPPVTFCEYTDVGDAPITSLRGLKELREIDWGTFCNQGLRVTGSSTANNLNYGFAPIGFDDTENIDVEYRMRSSTSTDNDVYAFLNITSIDGIYATGYVCGFRNGVLAIRRVEDQSTNLGTVIDSKDIDQSFYIEDTYRMRVSRIGNSFTLKIWRDGTDISDEVGGIDTNPLPATGRNGLGGRGFRAHSVTCDFYIPYRGYYE